MLMLQILLYFTVRQIVHPEEWASSHDSKEIHWKLRDEPKKIFNLESYKDV